MSDSQITTPIVKSVTALGAGAGSSAVAISHQSASFLPADLAGWMALTASVMAILYTLHLMGEWYWKKLWRPFLRARGWIKQAGDV